MDFPLIGADQTFALWGVLIGLAAFGFWSERTRIGSRMSGAITVIVCSLLLSNLGVIPTASPVYDTVWAYLVPLAIPLLLFKADIRRIIRESGPTLIAFVIGALGTVLGAFVAFYLLPLGAEAADLAGIFTATYIGGSMNFAATADALQFTASDQLSAAVAADNVAGTLYLILLASMPAIAFFRRTYATAHIENAQTPTREETKAARPPLDLTHLMSGIGLSFGLCFAGFGIAALLDVPSIGILLITAFVVALATFLPKQIGSLEGDYEIGMALMYVFFGAIGAGADISALIGTAPILFLLASIILVFQFSAILIGGKLFNLDLSEMIIASNACALGPTTAAALAGAQGWKALVTPAILCGTLGYAVATFLGVGIAGWLG